MAMERKEYIAPTAEWLLLAPKEDLMTERPVRMMTLP